ncbi:Receptor-like protein 2 [Sesamum alatum]|uniref:Receptor-like protein 2 n=1 Tax=Sesamum alatum TaxID=300844 RepID=A0AAE2D085_9LAMI|nr:Receptor-like protein 2 [Sesamum alatum]
MNKKHGMVEWLRSLIFNLLTWVQIPADAISSPWPRLELGGPGAPEPGQTQVHQLEAVSSWGGPPEPRARPLTSSRCLAALSCNQIDHHSLVSFYHHISTPLPLNWSSSTPCCQWEGVACDIYGSRVTGLSLPGRALSGTITPFLANLSFLSHLNLSRNHLSGAFPLTLFHSFNRLRTLDLSFNRFSGLLQPHECSGSFFPISIRNLDLSSNRFNGTVDPLFLGRAKNLISVNVSNNSFSGLLPSSICRSSPLLRILDFSMNQFSGRIYDGIGECSKLQIFRAGFNSLSGWLPNDVYSVRTLREISLSNNRFSGPINGSIVLLSSLRVLELHVNELSGGLPTDIGLLSNLEQLQLHTNSLVGTLPASLVNCINLKTLLLRNNLFGGELSSLDFSELQKLQTIDLGNNSFVGKIPDSLCLCRSVTAVRLAINRLVGEIPPCMASLRSLTHLSVAENNLSNVVGALKTLSHCDNLKVLLMTRCFHDETAIHDNGLWYRSGFQNLQILSLEGCNLTGQIPSWIANVRNLKVLDLSDNRISGQIPTWLGEMPDLFVLNLTKNFLSGDLPPEIGRLPALTADKASSDLSYLALPFVLNRQEYNRLFNLPRGLKAGNNSLSGNIPAEIGQLKLLQALDLSNNNFNGSIPDKLSRLVHLETLDMSGNHLSGTIPQSLTGLHFLSSFSVADNDLEGEIPNGAQFDTFSSASFEGNPKLCGNVLKRKCRVVKQVEMEQPETESLWFNILIFGLGYMVGLLAISITLLFNNSWINFSFKD